MAERVFAPLFPGEGRGPVRCESSAMALVWAPAFAGELQVMLSAIDVVFGECDR